MPSVTFVGHDASRTGAPVLLASALRWLASEHPVDRRLVLLAGGPLLADLGRTQPTSVLPQRLLARSGQIAAAVRSTGRRWFDPDPVLRVVLGRQPRSDLVVANTLAALPAAALLAARGASRLVCHVHELDHVADRLLPPDPRQRQHLLGAVDRFVATGEPVARMLHRMGVDSVRVAIVDAWIDPPRTPRPERGAQLLGVDPDRPVVLAVGALGRRKGPERFVDLMEVLGRRVDGVQGRWLGADGDGPAAVEMNQDLGRLSIGSTELVAALEDPTDCIGAADVVVSTSVEDPFPLVALEAAASAVPVVGYDAGGLAQVLRSVDQPDAAVPVGDLLALADVVARTLDDPTTASGRGERLATWVRSTHVTDVLAPRWWDAVCG